MSPINNVLTSTIRAQLQQVENRIEEHRLDHIPDTEAIRNLQMAAETLRLELSRLAADEVIVAPI